MIGLIRTAWQGWHDYMHGGRMIALLIAFLLVYWLKEEWRKQEKFLSYTGASLLACILPVTAVLLMLYQTPFYEYKWIFGMVPVMGAVAFSLVDLYTVAYEKMELKIFSRGALLLGALGIVLLCGGLKDPNWTVKPVTEEMKYARQALEQLPARETTDASVVEKLPEEMCLWAPEAVMEYARSIRTDITLFYGRNMWDASLNGYSYDTYSPEKTECYIWMDWIVATGDLNSVSLDGIECLRNAVAQGANMILFPNTIKEESLAAIRQELGTEEIVLDGFYLFVVESNEAK